ncbi:hypothetical protein FQN60_006116 [Etheostoma spectabile]|uniref:Uncharacterized protein n=1 Tax=Etheostoma spectabile TaxID=54343 RepID=A0A5J5CNZ0_9PERO|nr:hypothetical protein FQN60_006116 [Etheostoma spectabile]
MTELPASQKTEITARASNSSKWTMFTRPDSEVNSQALKRHAHWEGSSSSSRRLSQSWPGAAKEVSATTGKPGAMPGRQAALPMNGALVKGGSEDT